MNFTGELTIIWMLAVAYYKEKGPAVAGTTMALRTTVRMARCSALVQKATF